MISIEYRKVQGLVGEQSFSIVLPKSYASHLGIGKGDFVRGYSTKIKDLSIKKYKQILLDKIQDVLEIAGYNVDKIKNDLIYENESMAVIYN